jgi:hypothetical protein
MEFPTEGGEGNEKRFRKKVFSTAGEKVAHPVPEGRLWVSIMPAVR